MNFNGTEITKSAQGTKFAIYHIRRNGAKRGLARIDFGKDLVNPDLVRVIATDTNKRPMSGFTFHADVDAALAYVASMVR